MKPTQFAYYMQGIFEVQSALTAESAVNVYKKAKNVTDDDDRTERAARAFADHTAGMLFAVVEGGAQDPAVLKAVSTAIKGRLDVLFRDEIDPAESKKKPSHEFNQNPTMRC